MRPPCGSKKDEPEVVFHKFHVISQVVKAVDEVRRRESKQDAAARAELARTSWLWRKNPENWTARESGYWAQLQSKPLATGLAYSMRLELQRAYQAGTAAQARERFLRWCEWVRTRWRRKWCNSQCRHQMLDVRFPPGRVVHKSIATALFALRLGPAESVRIKWRNAL